LPGGLAHEIQDGMTVDGKRIWADSRKYPIRGAAGEITGLFRDCAGHHGTNERAEALRESEALLRELQKIAGVGSYVLDIPSGVWRQFGSAG